MGKNSVLYQRLEQGVMTLSWLSIFCFRVSLTNLTQIKHPRCASDKSNVNELFISSKYCL